MFEMRHLEQTVVINGRKNIEACFPHVASQTFERDNKSCNEQMSFVLTSAATVRKEGPSQIQKADC